MTSSTPDRITLILSGSIGKGHDSVAQACEAALATREIPTQTLDCMRLLGQGGAAAGGAVFRRLLDVPAIYGGLHFSHLHFSHLRTGSWLAEWMDRQATSRLLPRLREEIDATGGSRTLLLAVFPTGASAAGKLTEERSDLDAVVLCTDATTHSMWVHKSIGMYVVCSRLAAATVRRYQPGAKIATVPPPVRPVFFEAPSRTSARASLNIEREESCVLLMAGGWGLGPLAESARALARGGHRVLAVAGLNKRTLTQLRKVASDEPAVPAFGFTDRVPELMAATDVVVTSPGQTCHEGRVVGRPLVILDVVPGHGRENAIHEMEAGGALACSPAPRSILAAVETMIAEGADLEPWPVQSQEEWDKHFITALEWGGIVLGENA